MAPRLEKYYCFIKAKREWKGGGQGREDSERAASAARSASEWLNLK